MTQVQFDEPDLSRPFPGLRSFTADESHLFFGREGQSNKVVTLLRHGGFVALVGTSGCGKSSLMRAGVLPVILGGGVGPRETKWQIVDFKPGADPMGGLAEALRRTLGSTDESTDWLRRGSSSLITAVEDARKAGTLEADENVLILVDQFEELFRYRIRSQSSEAGDRDEKAEFVALLLNAASRREARIYVVLTIRSDFLGDCAQFRDLPEAINGSQYLIPRMTRDQRQSAIEGPIRVAGATVSPQLVRMLLNDLGDDPDQLPVLQHALMRTWDVWSERGRREDPIDVEDYRAVGSLQQALGNHADLVLLEALEALGSPDSPVVKRIFQRLRIVDAQARETRSPATVCELAASANATTDAVRTALDCFRDDRNGRSFVTPFMSTVTHLGDDTQVDVTHESLLRRWPVLAGPWVAEEEDGRRIYTRLASAAEDDSNSAHNFLRGGALERAVDWWDRRKPSKTWAVRYHAGFEAARDYLTRSREADLQSKEARRQAELTELQRERQRVVETAQQEMLKSQLKSSRSKQRLAYLLALTAIGTTTAALYFGYRTRLEDAKKVTSLLANSSATAASEEGAPLVPSLLFAALSLSRAEQQDDPATMFEAQRLLSNALALLPPRVPSIVKNALQVDFGGNGALIVSLTRAGALHVRNVHTPNASEQVLGNQAVNGFAIARDTSFLVAYGADSNLVVWDAMTAQQRSSLKCPAVPRLVRMSAPGTVIAALCDHRVFAWQSKDGWKTHTPIVLHRSHRGNIWRRLALSDDGTVLATAGMVRDDGPRSDTSFSFSVTPVIVASTMRGKLLVADSTTNASALAITESDLIGHMLVVGHEGADEPGIDAWDLPDDPFSDVRAKALNDLAQKKPHFTYKVSSHVTSLSTTPRGQLVVGTRDGVASIVSSPGGEERARLVTTDSIQWIGVSADDSIAMVVARDDTVRAWKLSGRTNYLTRGLWMSAQFNAGGTLLLANDIAMKWNVLDLVKDRHASPSRTSGAGVSLLAIVPGDTQVLARSAGRLGERIASLKLIRYSGGRLGSDVWAAPLKVNGGMGSPRLSTDGAYTAAYVSSYSNFPMQSLLERKPGDLATPGNVLEPGIHIIQTQTGRRLVRRNWTVASSIYAPLLCFVGPRILLIGGRQTRTMGEIDVASGVAAPQRPSHIVPLGALTGLGCSQDGSMAALGEVSTTERKGIVGLDSVTKLRVLSYPLGQEIVTFDVPAQVGSITFSADGRFLTAITRDGAASLWDIRTKRALTTDRKLPSPLAAMVTPTGEFIVAGRSGAVSVPWRTHELITEACARAGRDLTGTEWKRYMKNERLMTICPQPR